MSTFSFLLLRFSSQAANIQLPMTNIVTCNFASENLKHEYLIIKKSQKAQNVPFLLSDHSKILTTESVYRFARLNSYNRTLFKDLVNKYWQQSVFLSTFNPTTDKYITKLARQRSADTKEKQKRFFIDFNKALVSDPIKASSITIGMSDNVNKSYPLHYIWKKGLNLPIPDSFSFLSSKKFFKGTSNVLNTQLLQNLKKSHLPLYVVVNSFREMIIPGPPNDFSNKDSVINEFRQWYYNVFFGNQNQQIAHQAWFFINPEDALEYKKSISTKKSGSSTETTLGILPSTFQFYYRLNRQSPPRTEFRLFPDLEEVEKLLYSAKHRKGLLFDSKQNMGRSYFQGQPIYLIEPTKLKIKGKKQLLNLKPCYRIPFGSSLEEYNPIFLTKTSALNAWSDLSVRYPEYRLPATPYLRVYNLEDFLKDQESKKNPNSFMLMPGSSSSRDNLELLNVVNSQDNLQYEQETNSAPVLTCKLWIQRLIWSLTRRKPPQWEV